MENQVPQWMKWIRLVDSQDLIYIDVYSITNLNDALIHDNEINKNLQNNRYNVMLFAWTHNGHLATYNPAHTNIHYSQQQTTSHIKYIHSATRSNIKPFSLLKSKCPHTSLFTHIFTTVTPPLLWFKQLAEETQKKLPLTVSTLTDDPLCHTSSSFNSMLGIPLLMGNSLPDSGHTNFPSITSIYRQKSKYWEWTWCPSYNQIHNSCR